MKIEKRKSPESAILTAMIVDSTALSRIHDLWKKDRFNSKMANIVGQWCIDYYTKHGKAPGRTIESIFTTWSSKQRDEDLVANIENLLASLSNKYKRLAKQSNTDYIIELAADHFNTTQAEHLRDLITGHLESGNLEKIYSSIQSYGAKVELGVGSYINVLQDASAIKKAFKKKREPLVLYPGAAGEFYSDAIERDSFIAFEGPEKRGKSYHLQDLAWRGMTQGRKVAYFEVGDMSEEQVIRERFMVRATRAPLKPGIIKYPTYLERKADSMLSTVDFEERIFKKGLDYKQALKACKRIINKYGMKEPLLRLSCYPNSTISAHGIRSVLRRWEKQDQWVADLVIIDYADILAPINGKQETRDQINETWKALRSLSQQYHCCVATATQSDADSYDALILTRKNFSGNKLKMAHVTAMIGLNQTPEEQENQVMRLNFPVRRNAFFPETKCLYIAGCYSIANPIIISSF